MASCTVEQVCPPSFRKDLHSRFSSELKELIAMHSSMHPLGGDLKRDTVTIIGATLDLQEKVVRQVRRDMSNAFSAYTQPLFRQ